MRTIDGQGLNHVKWRKGNTLYGTTEVVSFKDESSEFANNGTQLIERCGLPDIYYAMIGLLRWAKIEPNQKSEEVTAYSADESAGTSYTSSQILTALREIFFTRSEHRQSFDDVDYNDGNAYLKQLINHNYDNSGSDYKIGRRENSNAKLREAITDLENKNGGIKRITLKAKLPEAGDLKDPGTSYTWDKEGSGNNGKLPAGFDFNVFEKICSVTAFCVYIDDCENESDNTYRYMVPLSFSCSPAYPNSPKSIFSMRKDNSGNVISVTGIPNPGFYNKDREIYDRIVYVNIDFME